jgi:hypothetical protein
MAGFKVPDFRERQSAADKAKRVRLEKHRKASADPAVGERRAIRMAADGERIARKGKRKVEKKAREIQRAEETARAADLKLQSEREAEKLAVLALIEKAERETVLAAEQKAARDARYAARKAAKKQRRKG